MKAKKERERSAAPQQLPPLPGFTPAAMAHAGRRDGRDWKLCWGRPHFAARPPYPTRDNPRLPAIIDAHIAAAESQLAALEPDYQNRHGHLEQCVAKGEAAVASLSVGDRKLPPPEKTLNTFVYACILGGLGLSEWVVNAGTFTVFGARNYVTYIIALVVAIVMPLCAHVTGISWKENRYGKSAILAVTLAVSLIVGIALIRQAYFYSYVQGLLGLNIAPWLLAVIYVVINLTMFGGGTLASFRHAQTDPEGQDARIQLEAAQMQLSADRALLQQLPGQYMALCRQQPARVRASAYAYSRGNMAARRRARNLEDREQPVCFERLRAIVVTIPDFLLAGQPATAARPAGQNPAVSRTNSSAPRPVLSLAADVSGVAAPSSPWAGVDRGADDHGMRVRAASGANSTSTPEFGTVYVDGLDEPEVQ